MLTTLTFNLKNTAIRFEKLHGRDYIVAPVAMLTEGVHSGSSGKLLYREAECRRAVPAWNMKPVVVYHPEINGRGVTACDPTILERQQVGMVMNTKWMGKLRAEAWIETDRARQVDARVLDALENNRMMEVSTGLFTDNIGKPGVWNEEAYDAEATNHQPDHLALLPDQIGACSIADGAGLLQLNEAADSAGLDLTGVFARQIDDLRRLVGNAMSHANIFAALTRALGERFGKKDVWILDVFDTFFVYSAENDNKLYRATYAKGDAGVDITGEPEEVVRVTEYRTPKGEFVGNKATKNKENPVMDKAQIVQRLIDNQATKWGADDRDALLALNEDTLAKMEPVAQAPAPQVPAAATPKDDDDEPARNAAPAPAPLTVEQFVAAAPPEFRDVLTNSLATHNAAKDTLIKTITTNKRNRFSAEYLATKGIQELQGLAALAQDANAAPTANGRVPMFDGAATPGEGITANAAPQEAPLTAPMIDFSRK